LPVGDSAQLTFINWVKEAVLPLFPVTVSLIVNGPPHVRKEYVGTMLVEVQY
jgi:hypothetical protein